MLRAPGRVVATASILGLLSACATTQPARPRPTYPSSSYPAATGRAPVSDADLAHEAAVLRGRAERHLAEQQARVDRVGKRLLETIPSHPNVEFVLVPGDQSINAGATFGQVAITSGMLNFIESDDEMAVVLGHEIAHITEGHVMKGTLSGLAVNALALALAIGAHAPQAGQAAGQIGQLFLNHYTQTQEREADDVGLRYAYEAGYDPRVAATIQERLAVEVPQSMSAGYFDTHPSSVERAVTARAHAEELLAQGPPPGRAEALALERADLRRERATQAPPSSRAAPVPGNVTVPPGGSVDLDACRRAEVYVEMARDARTAEEREELNERARRYCPRLADAEKPNASTRPSRSGPSEDVDVPLDKY